MTIHQILLKTVKKLKKNNIKNPHLEAELLLSAILKKPREYILSHPDYKLNCLQIINYKLKITRRIGGSPLAYLTRSKGFYGRNFYVNKNVLIPRPETEMMIDEALKLKEEKIFIDIGTGSGCIIISLIKELQKRNVFINNYKFYASDVSKNALIIAKKNAKIYKVDNLIKFYQSNLLDSIINKFKNINSQIIICANLPYLTLEQIKNSPSIQKEPKLALKAGSDGLKYYRKLLPQVAKLKMKNEKLRIIIYLEIDDIQKNSIQKLIKEVLPSSKYKIKTDLRNKSRLVIIKL
ncbi:MAG: peptide chain release factor N(5)-glutamine methyltransferase [Patescibacteria group bacterium]|nr:peptide chain release factor N(5)-glutamine methyltransferase [Patescibacteria group bacterium]